MLANPRTFRCPNCNEMINDSMTTCRYCSTPVDPSIAAMIAERQEKTNRACSDASYLKTASVAMMVFLGLSFIPFLPLVYWGFLITFIVVLVLLILWHVRFGSLVTNDPDFQRARRSKNIALILLIVAAPLGFIIRPLLDLILSLLIASR
jgi:NO-binding membrane sensor protein with MHYT domain